MSHKEDRQLIVPGAQGWELWAIEANAAAAPRLVESAESPRQLKSVGAGATLLLFPVRDVLAMPFKAATVDEALFEDLAALHIERLGVRPDPLGGQLTDHFLITSGGDQASLLAVALTVPEDGLLPARPVGAFDFTARCLPLADGKVAVWRELGRWVFALASGGKLAYCQATSSDAPLPDESVATEIRMAVAQLAMQGLALQPSGCVLWLQAETAEGVRAIELEQALRLPVEIAGRPSPAWPSPASRLLPADVRAEREARVTRQRVRSLMSLAAVAVLAVGAWLGWQLWSESRELAVLVARAKQLEPQAQAYKTHKEKWNELTPVIHPDQWPIEILLRVVKQVPPAGGLRLTQAVIQSGEIRIAGEAPDATPIGQFDLALTRSNELVGYKWQNPPGTQNSHGTLSFTFIGTPVSATTP